VQAEKTQQSTTEKQHPTEEPEMPKMTEEPNRIADKKSNKQTPSNTTYEDDDEIGHIPYPDEEEIAIKDKSPEDAHITINHNNK